MELRLTQYIEELAKRSPAVHKQFYPSPLEDEPDEQAMDDPLGEALYHAAPGLVHQYADRALLLASNKCFAYCRHCFRRLWIHNSNNSPPSNLPPSNIPPSPCGRGRGRGAYVAYLHNHPEIKEILLSGGDPLTLSDEELRSLFADIRQASPDIAFRLCTRAPVVLPSRISNEFVAMCASFKPLRLSIHLNHPDELTSECRHALSCFVNAGIPVLVQTVLLRGINDSVDTLTCLFRQCLSLGLQPYYLFQLDLARGTKHFRVPLEEGLELYDRVKEGLSPVPPYAVDLPGGGGKIRLSKEIIAGIIATEKGRFYQLRDKDGRLWLYPAF